MKSLKLVVMLLTCLLFTGCATLMNIMDAGSDKAASGVKEYCDQLGEQARREFRTAVNLKLREGESIIIVCSNDETLF
jgi:uncharacterized protein YceK